MFGWLLGAAIVLAWIAALVHIVRHRRARSAASTVLWVLVVLILPMVGTAAYFLTYKWKKEMGELDEGPPVINEPVAASPYGDDLDLGAARDPDATRFGR